MLLYRHSAQAAVPINTHLGQASLKFTEVQPEIISSNMTNRV
jgi:hypothetical protein